MRIAVGKVMSLNPCYSRAKVAGILKGKSLFDALMSVPYQDARWLISRLLDRDGLEHWAYGCAGRAAGYYADAGDYAHCAADAAYYAGYYAAYYANATDAAYYAHYAADAAGYCDQERRDSIAHAVGMIEDMPDES